ncbi:hypothetical protein LUZ63_007721 [Rhynchospora breviuscula]|uniref:Association with the SNF1 complex (ASC) domain-containing protein n=1 Tax=Rhynchospora breviuscula TaxID=2022672 RepID=A0A9Q0HUP4_9POAL|nr:hypothetical protein LUZ63_007721 [Rhynchospora breviuscula]
MGNVSGKDETDENGELDESELEEEGSVTSSHREFAPPLPGHVSRTRSGGSPPASPGQSRSPRMFVPQTPVSPLQKPADPVFNQVLMKDHQEELFDYPPEKEIPVLLVWTFGGKNVSVEGSWDHWKSRKSLQKSGKDFSILLALPSGVYRYTFVVDGERRCIPDLPNMTDELGNAVNVLDVNDYVPENTESVSEFDPPPSPTASYGWVMPDDKEMSKDPPIVPPQLPNGFLGSHNSNEEDFPKPQHIVLNHLFIERGLVSQPIVALGLTHRFESKYVTVVLYKPVER